MPRNVRVGDEGGEGPLGRLAYGAPGGVELGQDEAASGEGPRDLVVVLVGRADPNPATGCGGEGGGWGGGSCQVVDSRRYGLAKGRRRSGICSS